MARFVGVARGFRCNSGAQSHVGDFLQDVASLLPSVFLSYIEGSLGYDISIEAGISSLFNDADED